MSNWDESEHPRHPAGSSKGGEFRIVFPGEPAEPLRCRLKELGIPWEVEQ